MKKLFVLGVLAASVLASTLSAQVILTPTTLSAAAASGAKTIVVASATPNAATADNFAVGTVVVIDNSLGYVSSVSGTTIGVNWASSSGTQVRAHASGALVWSGATNHLFAKPNDPSGSCTRTNESVLPYVNALTGNISDCLGGRWVKGAITQWPPFRVFTLNTGGTAYTSINTAGTTLGATTMYCSELDVPANKLLTGLAVLNGTTVGTDKHLVALYDSGGNLLANSAVAGATSANASVFQQFAFTSPYMAVGPAQYFACMQTNGTTDTVRMAVTGGSADNILTKGVTGQTFGTLAAFTVPTTFTTAVGPYAYGY